MKSNIQNFLLESNIKHDGGIDSLIHIVKHYKSNQIMIELRDIVSAYYNYSSFLSIDVVASRCGLFSVTCEDIGVNDIIEYNQPVIVNISKSKNSFHFVVCYKYDSEKGFYIIDSINGNYYASVIGFQSIWSDGKCIAFVSVN